MECVKTPSQLHDLKHFPKMECEQCLVTLLVNNSCHNSLFVIHDENCQEKVHYLIMFLVGSVLSTSLVIVSISKAEKKLF